MLEVAGQIEICCSLEHAWELFCRFGDVARLIPTVEEVQVDGDDVLARVVVKLGKLSISSRLVLRVTDRKPLAGIKAEGISYLGETIQTQLAKKPLAEIDADSVGRLKLHLELRPAEQADRIIVLYRAEVEADGRLKRIYQSILKLKAPAMLREFAENLKRQLEAEPAASRATDAPGPTTRARPGWTRRLLHLLGWAR